jgi:hypothetical protein
MKPSLSYCILAVFSLVLAVAGCGRKNTASQVTPLENATNVQSVFQNASEDIKQQAGEVVAAVQSQNSVAAYTRLENLSGRSNLTPEQQQAILDMRMALVRQLQAESTNSLLKNI